MELKRSHLTNNLGKKFTYSKQSTKKKNQKTIKQSNTLINHNFTQFYNWISIIDNCFLGLIDYFLLIQLYLCWIID